MFSLLINFFFLLYYQALGIWNLVLKPTTKTKQKIVCFFFFSFVHIVRVLFICLWLLRIRELNYNILLCFFFFFFCFSRNIVNSCWVRWGWWTKVLWLFFLLLVDFIWNILWWFVWLLICLFGFISIVNCFIKPKRIKGRQIRPYQLSEVSRIVELFFRLRV